jgi:hypothetical protein
MSACVSDEWVMGEETEEEQRFNSRMKKRYEDIKAKLERQS